MIPGLVSVTFRTLSVDEIISLACQAGLGCIEWGGDVHIPHGDTTLAQETAKKMRAVGLETSSYGSYYRAGDSNESSFQSVLETAAALESRKIRIWAGCRNAEEVDDDLWQRIADDIRRVATLAAQDDREVVLEFHANTLTNSAASARKLLEELEPTGTGLIWQAMSRLSPEENLRHLSLLAPYIRHVHCFYSAPPEYLRSPLEVGATAWTPYLHALSRIPGASEILLEFVRNDNPEQFLADARTLRKLL